MGEDVILCCETIPADLKLMWEKNGQNLYCVEGKHCMQQNGRLLVIKNAEQGDEGMYTVKLENSKGEASCSATVTVGM